MSFAICGIGTAVPAYSIDQHDAALLARQICDPHHEQTRALLSLYRHTQVRRRHSVLLQKAESRSADALASPGSTVTSAHQRNGGCSVSTTVTPVRQEPSSAVTQSFYDPATSGDDCGPTTAQRMLVYEQHAGQLANRAAVNALNTSGITPSSVTHLVTVSCTGFSAPGVDTELIRQLGLPAGTARTHVGFMGCHGALNGLRLALTFTEADPSACVLVCAVELCSLHQQYGWRPDRIIANALFADGAAAIVGTQPGNHDEPPWQVVASGSTMLAGSEDMMKWSVGDHGFEMTLSPRVPGIIRQELRPWLRTWLLQHGLSIQDVGSWSIHPGGPRILKACADAAGLKPEHLRASKEVLADYGNMSSPTVLFILEQLMREDASRPCVMLAFGPGLSIEAALIR